MASHDRPPLDDGPPVDDGRPVADGPAVTAGLRHVAPPDPEEVGDDPELSARLRAEIAERGPIPFARFMERALYEPGHGYYRRVEAGPGRRGDFLTAPETHPIFGAAMARLVEAAWEALDRPAPFTITEPGAGGGALAAGLLTDLRRRRAPLLDAVRYRPLEVEPQRVAELEHRLDSAGFADLIEPAPPGRSEVGAVIANEVVDALPVHRVVRREGRLRERLVDAVADGFVEVEGDPSTPALEARLRAEEIELPDGVVAELCLAIDGWLESATAHLGRGIVVLVDYGDDAKRLYGSDRPDGTLRAFARHSVSGATLRHVGRQDLTAHVDLTAVRRAALTLGLDELGATTQAELLATVGVGDVVSATLREPGATLEAALSLRSALARLMNPRGMGGFHVLAFGRGLPLGARLPGFERLRIRPGTPAQGVET
jgi:SAM-dependent MidA family methyltransferase